jgi:Fe-Mn family superoxide dismutase
MDFSLPDLPYAEDALAPWLSAASIRHHREIERAALTALEREVGASDRTLEQLVLSSSGRIFNLAAQAYAHRCFWRSLRPGGGGAPPPGLGDWREEIIRSGCDRFASGYLWLVLDDDRIDLLPTPNAETPLGLGMAPLLVIDLWEHAYYLDYQERRDRYLEAVCERLLCWDHALENLATSRA